MKVYIVTKQSKCDYDFSVETTKHGAFFNFDKAVERVREVINDFKPSIEKDIKRFSNVDVYHDEDGGLYTETDEISEGFWECHYGCQEHYETHCICVDEFEIEDADTFFESRARYRLKSYSDEDDSFEEFYAMLTPSEVDFIEKDLTGHYFASFNIRTENDEVIEIGIIDAIEKVEE